MPFRQILILPQLTRLNSRGLLSPRLLPPFLCPRLPSTSPATTNHSRSWLRNYGRSHLLNDHLHSPNSQHRWIRAPRRLMQGLTDLPRVRAHRFHSMYVVHRSGATVSTANVKAQPPLSLVKLERPPSNHIKAAKGKRKAEPMDAGRIFEGGMRLVPTSVDFK